MNLRFGDLEIVKPCKRNVDFFVAAFLALDLQRSASIADALPGQLRGAAMIGQGGFDRLDVVECETPLSALDVTDHLRLRFKCEHLAGLADRARQPKAIDALVRADVDDRSALQIKAHERLQWQFLGTKAVTQAANEKMHVLKIDQCGPPERAYFPWLYSSSIISWRPGRRTSAISRWLSAKSVFGWTMSQTAQEALTGRNRAGRF